MLLKMHALHGVMIYGILYEDNIELSLYLSGKDTVI